MNIKYVEAKNAEDLHRLQDVAIRATGKAREAVQIAAVATIIHAAKHGDWTGTNRLVEGLGNTINGQALVQWFVKFGGLVVNAEGTAFGGFQGPDYIKANLDEAKDKMWWDLRKVNPFAGYNADMELMKFVEKHAKLRKQIAGMRPEDAAKVSFIINDKTMMAVLQLVDFEHIIQVVREDAAGAEAPAADANDQGDKVVAVNVH